MDFRVQGVPQRAVLEDRGRTTRIHKLAHALKTHSRTESMITDLQIIDEFDTFSEESNRTSQSKLEKDRFVRIG